MPAERIAAIETWKDTFIESYREDRAEAQRQRNDVEQRLRRLEKALYCCTGALFVLQVILKVMH